MASVLITGGSGLIGRALWAALKQRGDKVVNLTRRAPAGDLERQWDGEDEVRLHPADRFEIVIHLAGEPIAQRWSAGVHRRIRDSRVQGTGALVSALGRLEAPPEVFIGASAVGYYGDRGDEQLDERSTRGSGFLAEVAEAWEQAASPLDGCGARVAHARLGIVLSPAGGALKLMLPAFRLGLGGRLGSGRQWLSWIALPDVVAAFLHLIDNPGLKGPLNFTAPNPVTNSQFSETLARVLSRPARIPVPALALRLALGEMADQALLSSTRVVPKRLLDSNFSFGYTELEPALRALLA